MRRENWPSTVPFGCSEAHSTDLWGAPSVSHHKVGEIPLQALTPNPSPTFGVLSPHPTTPIKIHSGKCLENAFIPWSDGAEGSPLSVRPQGSIPRYGWRPIVQHTLPGSFRSRIRALPSGCLAQTVQTVRSWGAVQRARALGTRVQNPNPPLAGCITLAKYLASPVSPVRLAVHYVLQG